MEKIEGKEVVVGFIKERIAFCTNLLENCTKYNQSCAVSKEDLQSTITNLKEAIKQVGGGKMLVEDKKFLLGFINECREINKRQQEITPQDNTVLQEISVRLQNDEKYLLIVYMYAMDIPHH